MCVLDRLNEHKSWLLVAKHNHPCNVDRAAVGRCVITSEVDEKPQDLSACVSQRLSCNLQEAHMIEEVQTRSAFPHFLPYEFVLTFFFLPRHLKVSSSAPCVVSVATLSAGLSGVVPGTFCASTQKVNNAFRFFHDMQHRRYSPDSIIRQGSRHCSQTGWLILKEQLKQEQKSSHCLPFPTCQGKVRGRFLVHRTFLERHSETCSILLSNRRSWGLVKKVNKQREK